ncbi:MULTISPECIES: DeoR family transcriptional regulator [Enterococcus]|uniref:DeoR/GlpR family DNA-binding transcription regulator n=1 Tax=Enterococcus sp. AZ103 TaxID=2774628 RepID=UPI003F251883
MLKEERQQTIIDILNSEQKVIASDLSARLEVSEDTIRRDLKELDSKGLLKRVHSGALRVGPPVTDFSFRINLDNDKKTALAKKALPFLKEDSVIIIDGSTTNLALANEIPLDFRGRIITNSPPIAMALSQHKNLEVINLGGEFYKQSMINIGVTTYKSLKQIRADLYVMGVYNLDLDAGTSVPTIAEAEIKQEMTRCATEVLGMATTDKFSTVSHAIVGPIDDLTYLIAEKLPNQIRREYSLKDVLLID